MMIQIMAEHNIAIDECTPIDIYSCISIEEIINILKEVDVDKTEICDVLDKHQIKYEWEGGLNSNMGEVITYYSRYDSPYKVIRVQEEKSLFDDFGEELEFTEVYGSDLVTTQIIKLPK